MIPIQGPTRLIIKKTNMSFLQVGMFAIPLFLAIISIIRTFGVNNEAAMWAASTSVWVIISFYHAYQATASLNLVESLLVAITAWVLELKAADEIDKKAQLLQEDNK